MANRLMLVAVAILASGVLAGCSGGAAASGNANGQIDAHAKPTGPRPGVGLSGSAPGAAANAQPQ